MFLLPPHQRRVYESKYPGTSEGHNSANELVPTTIVYAARHRSLLVATRGGDLVLFSLAKRAFVKSVTVAKEDRMVKTVVLSPDERFAVTGSSDGSVKVFSFPKLIELQSCVGAHQRSKTFAISSSTLGVSDLELVENSLFSCGGDGRVVRYPLMAT